MYNPDDITTAQNEAREDVKAAKSDESKSLKQEIAASQKNSCDFDIEDEDLVTRANGISIGKRVDLPGSYRFYLDESCVFSTQAKNKTDAVNQYRKSIGEVPITVTTKKIEQDFSDRYFFGEVSDYEMDIYM